MPEKLTSVSHCKSKQCWRLSNSVQGITAVLCSHSSDTQCSTAFRLLRRNSVPLVLTGCYKLLWCLAGQSPGGYLVSPLSVKCIAMQFLANTELKGESESVSHVGWAKHICMRLFTCVKVLSPKLHILLSIRYKGLEASEWHWGDIGLGSYFFGSDTWYGCSSSITSDYIPRWLIYRGCWNPDKFPPSNFNGKQVFYLATKNNAISIRSWQSCAGLGFWLFPTCAALSFFLNITVKEVWCLSSQTGFQHWPKEQWCKAVQSEVL